MSKVLDDLVTSLDIQLHAFAVCEVQTNARLAFDAMDAPRLPSGLPRRSPSAHRRSRIHDAPAPPSNAGATWVDKLLGVGEALQEE